MAMSSSISYVNHLEVNQCCFANRCAKQTHTYQVLCGTQPVTYKSIAAQSYPNKICRHDSAGNRHFSWTVFAPRILRENALPSAHYDTLGDFQRHLPPPTPRPTPHTPDCKVMGTGRGVEQACNANGARLGRLGELGGGSKLVCGRICSEPSWKEGNA